MNRFKLVSAFFVITAAIIGSYVVINNSSSGFLTNKAMDENRGNQSNEQFKKREILSEKPLSEINKDNISSKNFTQIFTQSIIEKIKTADFSNKKDLSSLKSLRVSDLSDFIKRSFNGLDFVSDIDYSEIKVSYNNSKEEKIKYLETIKEIHKKNIGDFHKSYLEVIIDVFEKTDVSSALRWAEIYRNLTIDYLNIDVPSDWVVFHKAAIIYFKNAEIVNRAMADYLNDPFKGYWALEMTDRIIEEGKRAQALLEQKKLKDGIK